MKTARILRKFAKKFPLFSAFFTWGYFRIGFRSSIAHMQYTLDAFYYFFSVHSSFVRVKSKSQSVSNHDITSLLFISHPLFFHFFNFTSSIIVNTCALCSVPITSERYFSDEFSELLNNFKLSTRREEKKQKSRCEQRHNRHSTRLNWTNLLLKSVNKCKCYLVPLAPVIYVLRALFSAFSRNMFNLAESEWSHAIYSLTFQFVKISAESELLK